MLLPGAPVRVCRGVLPQVGLRLVEHVVAPAALQPDLAVDHAPVVLVVVEIQLGEGDGFKTSWLGELMLSVLEIVTWTVKVMLRVSGGAGVAEERWREEKVRGGKWAAA